MAARAGVKLGNPSTPDATTVALSKKVLKEKKITETKTQVYEFTETTIRLPLFSPPLPKDILCQLAIPGEPGTKGRPRFNGHVYTPQETKDAEEYFAWIVRCSYPQLIPNRSHALGVCVAFFTKTRHRKDLDNLVKLIFDACNGVIWADDMQIIQLSSTVIRGDSMPRTELLVYTIGDGSNLDCEGCGIPLQKKGVFSTTNRSDRFCSKICYDEAQRKGAYIYCFTCKKRVYKDNERLLQTHQFCSPRCRTLSFTREKICRNCSQTFRGSISYVSLHSFCSPICRQAWHSEHRKPSQKKGICPACNGPSSRVGQRCYPCFVIKRFGRKALTDEEQSIIFGLWSDGQSMNGIAKTYQISTGAISRVIHRNTPVVFT